MLYVVANKECPDDCGEHNPYCPTNNLEYWMRCFILGWLSLGLNIHD